MDPDSFQKRADLWPFHRSGAGGAQRLADRTRWLNLMIKNAANSPKCSLNSFTGWSSLRIAWDDWLASRNSPDWCSLGSVGLQARLLLVAFGILPTIFHLNRMFHYRTHFSELIRLPNASRHIWNLISAFHYQVTLPKEPWNKECWKTDFLILNFKKNPKETKKRFNRRGVKRCRGVL